MSGWLDAFRSNCTCVYWKLLFNILYILLKFLLASNKISKSIAIQRFFFHFFLSVWNFVGVCASRFHFRRRFIDQYKIRLQARQSHQHRFFDDVDRDFRLRSRKDSLWIRFTWGLPILGQSKSNLSFTWRKTRRLFVLLDDPILVSVFFV